MTSERLNVRRMQIPESKSEDSTLHFDVEKEISKGMWAQAYKKVLDKRSPDTYALGLAEAMQLLDPEMRTKADLSQKDRWKAIVEQERQKVRNGGLRHSLVEYLAQYKVVTGENLATPEEIGDLHDEANGWGTNIENWAYAVHLLPNLKILEPDYDDFDKERVADYFEKLKQQYRRDSEWNNYAHVSAREKILGTEAISAVNLEEWKALVRHLTRWDYKEDYYLQHIFKHAADLQILQAEQIALTDRGIDLTLPSVQTSLNESTKLPNSLEL